MALMMAMPFASWANPAVQEDSVTSLKHYTFLDNMYIGIHVGPTSGLSENMRPREYFKLGAHHMVVVYRSVSSSRLSSVYVLLDTT